MNEPHVWTWMVHDETTEIVRCAKCGRTMYRNGKHLACLGVQEHSKYHLYTILDVTRARR